MIFNKTLLILSLLCLLCFGCKKEEVVDKPSPNAIKVTIENVGRLDFNGLWQNPNTEEFSDCKYSFARTFEKLGSDDIYYSHFFLIQAYDCDIEKRTLPYKVKDYLFSMNLGDLSQSAVYMASTDKKNEVDLIITSIKNKRIKGTFSGNLARLYDGAETLHVQGEFDIDYRVKPF